jgi:hypothetical protein
MGWATFWAIFFTSPSGHPGYCLGLLGCQTQRWIELDLMQNLYSSIEYLGSLRVRLWTMGKGGGERGGKGLECGVNLSLKNVTYGRTRWLEKALLYFQAKQKLFLTKKELLYIVSAMRLGGIIWGERQKVSWRFCHENPIEISDCFFRTEKKFSGPVLKNCTVLAFWDKGCFCESFAWDA